MKKQNGKKLVWSAAVLTLMLVGTACSGGNNNSETSVSPSAPAATVSPSGSSTPAEAPTASPSASSTVEAKTSSGEFQGVMDPHTIEIKMDGKAEAFQVDPDTATKVADWKTGTKVSFQYEEKIVDADGQQQKQLVITVIDKA